jgi:hypothetical protein
MTFQVGECVRPAGSSKLGRIIRINGNSATIALSDGAIISLFITMLSKAETN